MKHLLCTFLALFVISIYYCASQNVIYEVGQDTMIYDAKNNYVKNSKNKLKRFGATCESFYTKETSSIFYPSILAAFPNDSIREYVNKNVGFIVYTVTNQKNEIVELSFGILNVDMSSTLAAAFIQIEKRMIGKVLQETHQCPDIEFFHTIFYIRFKNIYNDIE